MFCEVESLCTGALYPAATPPKTAADAPNKAINIAKKQKNLGPDFFFSPNGYIVAAGENDLGEP